VIFLLGFEKIIAEQFSFVKELQNKENKSAIVMRHKTLSAEIVVLDFVGNGEVYKSSLAVNHPNLPRIYEVKQDGNRCKVIEEYINGTTVADILATGLYTVDGVKEVVKELCNALSILHSRNIIHRDIKPENVMIDKNGDVKLIDFDASRIYKSYQSNDTSFIGTAGFAAPEQYGITQTDARADIFALGVLMNVMLTGEHPSKKLHKGKLTKIMEKCINVDPNKRYSSVEELYKTIL